LHLLEFGIGHHLKFHFETEIKKPLKALILSPLTGLEEVR